MGACKMKKRTWRLTLLVTLLMASGGTLLLWKTGFFQAATSLGGIQAYIEKFSPHSQLVFFFVQLASVILAPIPSNITAAAGALLFGVWTSFFLTWAAVVVGSLTVFCLARLLGRAFVGRFVSEKVSERYLEVIRRKQDIFLSLVFLFPFFPDDIICILAGLTDIRPSRFLLIVMLFRPWGLLTACAVGGSVISIPLWGMALIGIIGLLLSAAGLRYGDQFERAFLERMKKD